MSEQVENHRKPWHVAEDKYGWCLLNVSESGGSHRVGFGSRAEAEAELARCAVNGRCRECDDVLYDHWYDEVKARVLGEKLCHSCLFWADYVRSKGDPTHVVVKGRHYVIEPNRQGRAGGFIGHGGAEFVIRFFDGREVTTRNLWAQGIVPEWFRDRLPDSGEFVTRGHRRIGAYAGYGGAGSADSDCAL
jgi:hypothetical protein